MGACLAHCCAARPRRYRNPTDPGFRVVVRVRASWCNGAKEDHADRYMKRRLLHATSLAYRGGPGDAPDAVGWIEPPIVVRRNAEMGRRTIDQALVGRVREGVIVAIRGSLPPFATGGQDGFAVLLDWLNDGLALCVEAPEYGGGVHLGFADSMHRQWDAAVGQPGIRRTVQKMLDLNRFDRAARPHLFLPGHSKAGV